MVFSSLVFLYAFLPLCLIATYAAKKVSVQNNILLVFSLFFYAWGEPVWVFLMVATGVAVWAIGLRVDRSRTRAEARGWLTLGVVAALSSLVIFKYSGFIFQTLNSLLGTSLPEKTFALPIGISFYTFQILTYLIDLYRGDAKVQTSVRDLLLYEALFPQLIAGPIVRYSDVAEQIRHRRMTFDETVVGIRRFLTGLAKKVLIANQAGTIVRLTLESQHLIRLDGLEAWIGIFAFAFQIYFDFSGYSDMAIGLGHMFGFRFKENFNYPYYATSVTDFWRRWHISLGTFFRDYVYIPLGGNRRGIKRQIFNMFVVWSLTGLWHGASWNFVLWGVYYFILLTIEKLFLLKKLEKAPRFVAHLYTWLTFLVGWVFFKMETLGAIGTLFRRMFFIRSNFVTARGLVLLQNHLPFLLIALIFSLPVLPWLRSKQPIRRWISRFRKKEPLYGILLSAWHVIIMLLCTVSLVASSFNPFLYFRF